MRRLSLFIVCVATVAVFPSCGGGSGTGNNNGNQNPLVQAAAARFGAFGMRVNVGQALVQPLAPIESFVGGVRDDSPTDAPQYFTRFFLRVDDVDLAPTERLEVCRGEDAVGNAQFSLLVQGGTPRRLVLQARLDNGTVLESPPDSQEIVPPGYNQIDLLWSSAGFFQAGVNGTGQPGLGGLSNATGRIESVLLGVLGGDLDPGTTGFVDFDAFEGDKGIASFNLARETCNVPADSQGRALYPAPNCAWIPAIGERYFIIDGLPPGDTLELEIIHRNFVCFDTDCSQPGGLLGGDRSTFTSDAAIRVTGTGSFAGLSRLITMPLNSEVHTAPRTPGTGLQATNTDFFQQQGALFGDPDFDILQIIAGTSFGMPSPGQLTTQGLPSGEFVVDSFFDITYEIDFQGAPGGALDGLAGSTQGTVRIEMVADPLIFADGFESGDTSRWSSTVP